MTSTLLTHSRVDETPGGDVDFGHVTDGGRDREAEEGQRRRRDG